MVLAAEFSGVLGRPGVTRWPVIMQRQFQQFVELFVPLVQFVDRMVDIPAAFRSWYAQCTSVQQTVEISQVQFLGGCGCACCFSMTGVLVWSCSKLWSLRSCRSSGGRAMLGSTMDTCYASSRVAFGRILRFST